MKIIIMGVAGSGKSTVGNLLAENIGYPFFDADDFHSTENRLKMSQGIPLTDEDRASWLLSLRELLINNPRCVLACSALKEKYREILSVHANTYFVYLSGTYEQIKKRVQERSGHFMGAVMLESQFATLEEPKDALIIDIRHSPQQIVDIIRKELNP